MKQLISLLIVVIASYFLSTAFPWWTIIIAPLIAGFVLRATASRQFALGFLAIFIAWGVAAWMAYSGNAAILSVNIGQLFNGIPAGTLVWITAITGGIYGGLAQLTGHFLKSKSNRS